LCLQLEDPDNFENWEKLVRATETLEGGLNRNSSPQAIATTRDSYDRFLAKFPLLFGYWKKYADLEFSIAGTEAAEMVRLVSRVWHRFSDTPRSLSVVLPVSQLQ
jgi:pre-mRNA-processing factor 39